jgi:hypothetical protein
MKHLLTTIGIGIATVQLAAADPLSKDLAARIEAIPKFPWRDGAGRRHGQTEQLVLPSSRMLR